MTHGFTDRGVSTQISHVFGIAITTLLIVVLVSGVTGFVQDERAAIADSQLETVGNQLASQVERVDELGRHGGNVSVETSVDSTVIGTDYRVRIADGDACQTGTFHTDSCLVLVGTDIDASAKVPLNLSTDVGIEADAGGRFRLSVVDSPASTGTVQPLVDRQPRIGVGRSFEVDRFGTVVSPVNRPPIAKFTFSPGMPRSGSAVRFEAGESFDADGEIVAYKWDFDSDGTFDALGRNLSRSLDPGPHEVTLRVVDNEGGTTNVTKRLRVSGLAYGGDLDDTNDGADDGGESALTFTVTNEYAQSVAPSIEIVEILVDPKDDSLTELENDCGGSDCLFGDPDNDEEILVDDGDDGTVDSRTATDDYIHAGGQIIELDDPVRVSDGDSAKFWIGQFDEGDLTDAFDIGVRYRVDGRMNSTVVTDVPGSPNVEDVQIEHEADDDVNLVVLADKQLDTVEFDLGGDLSGTATGIDSTTPVGDLHRHELNVVGSLSSGTVKANLTVAETGGIPAYETRGSKTINESLAILSGDYVWQSPGNWDGATDSQGVVHASFGAHQSDRLTLGYPAADQFGSGLAGYWSLDGTADDASASGLSGSMVGGPGSDLGVFGTGSYQFDGNDDYVDIGDDLGDVHRGTSSLSAWVQTTDTGDPQTWQSPGILGVEENGGTDDIFWGWIDQFGQIGIQAGDSAAAMSSTEIDDGQWHHVAMTYDASSGQAQVFVDGDLEDSVTTRPGPIGTDFGSIGRIEDTAGSPEYFDGRLDEVRSYDRVLSASAVEELADLNGTLTTGWQSGTQPLGPSNASLQYAADIPSATAINVTVAADYDGDDTAEERSDVIELRDGQNAVDVTGLSGTARDFRIEVELETGSVVKSPTLKRIGLREDT
ncbi:DUF7266 family protein [Halosimplex pelagicum]|uniref:PKD domain-containing protein n=1 Tax=Halosimplex pelagicum TaxID=869886 RepID=A0A7D5T9P1_9EURY|nr:LamG-like jellyroll fold domain-containing protein [Halosimplex pelagicum]QLH80613.1 PKD domain-containing protein [Halosimplex pelagicum]